VGGSKILKTLQGPPPWKRGIILGKALHNQGPSRDYGKRIGGDIQRGGKNPVFDKQGKGRLTAPPWWQKNVSSSKKKKNLPARTGGEFIKFREVGDFFVRGGKKEPPGAKRRGKEAQRGNQRGGAICTSLNQALLLLRD